MKTQTVTVMMVVVTFFCTVYIISKLNRIEQLAKGEVV